MRKPSKRRAAVVHPGQLSLFGAVEQSEAMATPVPSGVRQETASRPSPAGGVSNPTQAHPQRGPAAASGAQDGHPEGHTALRRDDAVPALPPVGRTSARNGTVPILDPPSTDPAPKDHGPSEAAPSPSSKEHEQPGAVARRIPTKKPGQAVQPPPAPEPRDGAALDLHHAGGTDRREDPQTVCVSSATPGDTVQDACTASESHLDVPIAQRVEIYSVLKTLLTDEQPSDRASGAQRGGRSDRRETPK